MKNDSCNPTVLARNLNTYIGTMLNKHPSIHVFLPGVLPTCSNISAFNDKIKQYNHYLGDLCRTNPRLTYIDTNTFRFSSGALKPALGRGILTLFTLMMVDLNFILVDLSMLYVVTSICRSTSGSHQKRQAIMETPG